MFRVKGSDGSSCSDSPLLREFARRIGTLKILLVEFIPRATNFVSFLFFFQNALYFPPVRVTRKSYRVYRINFALSPSAFAFSLSLSPSFSRRNPLYRVNRLSSPRWRVPFRLLDSAGTDAPAERNVIMHKHTRGHLYPARRMIAINARGGG